MGLYIIKLCNMLGDYSYSKLSRVVPQLNKGQ